MAFGYDTGVTLRSWTAEQGYVFEDDWFAGDTLTGMIECALTPGAIGIAANVCNTGLSGVIDHTLVDPTRATFRASGLPTNSPIDFTSPTGRVTSFPRSCPMLDPAT